MKSITVNSFTVKPDMLFHIHITTDRHHWTNQSVAEYFGKKQAILNS